jgi:DNA invertase Pin-like site-specific DNA recombinase
VNDGVALYLRVSTEDQDLAGQERELRVYAEQRGWSVACVYAEKTGASGRVARAEHEALLLEAQSAVRGWRRVLVWSIDRWSREPSFVKTVGSIEQLESAGVRFHSFREPLLDSGEDGAPNMGRDILRGILPIIANFEAMRRSDRTRVAMQELRSGRRRTKSGRPIGRPRKVTPELARKVLELREGPERRTWAEIARIVHLPAGTCRKVPRALRGETPSVEKGQGGFRTLSAAPEEVGTAPR